LLVGDNPFGAIVSLEIDVAVVDFIGRVEGGNAVPADGGDDNEARLLEDRAFAAEARFGSETGPI
jgi:hypothetical protein